MQKFVPRAALAFFPVLAVLGGCVDLEGTGGDEEGLLPIRSVLEVAGPEGIEVVESITGLQQSSLGNEWTWNALDGMLKDSVRLLAVQSLAEAELAYVESHDLDSGSQEIGGEQEPIDAVCLFDLNWEEAPGEFFLARATGGAPDYPDDVPFQGTGGSARGNGGGGGSGSSEGTARLSAGDWMLFATALAGYDPGLALSDGGHWTVRFGSQAPLRIIELVPAQFRCGAGFRSLEGGTATPSPVPAYQGGALTSAALYGADFSFCPQFDLLANPATAQSNAASIDFLGVVSDLSPVSGTSLTDGGQGSMTLTVDQWVGSPWWSMTGMVRPGFGASFLCS